jgi:polyadenylate-binding protein
VGNLDPQVTEQTLYEHFSRIGPVMSVRVCLDTSTQKSLGYGYVNFQNPTDAEKALDELGVKLFSKFIRVSRIQRDPSQRRSGVNNIIVKRLPATIDVPALKEIFSRFGRIVSLRLATDETGSSRGYAYIAFEKEDAAIESVKEINNSEIDGKPITVERFSPGHRDQIQKQFTNLYVKNLASNVTDESLSQFFSQFGQVTSSKVRIDANGSSMGFGYVAFDSHDDAARAIDELNDKPSPIAKEGEKLSVRRFQSRSERARDRDRLRRERQLQYSKYPNLYVKNFDENITNDRLKELFERVGATISVRVMEHPVTKVSRCFGFVSMKDQAGAMKAISELSGSTFLGSRPLFVTYALKKDVRRQTLDDMNKKLRAPRQQQMGGMMGGGGGPGGMPFPPQMPNPMPNQMFSGGMGPGGMGMRPASMQHMMQSAQMQQQMMQPRMQQSAPMMQSPFTGPFPPHRLPPNPMPIARKMPMPVPPQMVPPPQQQPQQQMVQQPQQSLASILASMNPEQQKNVLGERLYNYILRRHPNEAAKVTGMLLEMDNAEILNLLDTNDLLDNKISEALEVLQRHNNM